MKIAYSGISGRIGSFIDKYRSASSHVLDRSVFNWEVPDSYKSLNSYNRVFLSFPVNKINILELLPRFVETIRPQQTIVKFGSLGPQKVIHNIIDKELRKYCRVISLRLAPTMESVLDEQVSNGILYDYRYGHPAPYVAAVDAAALAIKATEGNVSKDILSVTGSQNLNINDLQTLFGERACQTKTLDVSAFVKQYNIYDSTIQDQIAAAYDLYKSWHPTPSNDLVENNIQPLTFEQWLNTHYAN